MYISKINKSNTFFPLTSLSTKLLKSLHAINTLFINIATLFSYIVSEGGDANIMIYKTSITE